MSKIVNLIFPHQLYLDSPLLENDHPIYLIEEYLFFKQYKFHKQKIAFHRASMMCYADQLKKKGRKIKYIDATDKQSDIRIFIAENKDIKSIHYIDPTDNWLEKRLEVFSNHGELIKYPSPQFLNTKKDNTHFFKPNKKFFFHTVFYKQQRKRLNLLLDEDGSPRGGKWSYDSDNRKKYPKGKMPPQVNFPLESNYWKEALVYTSKHFKDNPGSLEGERQYPCNHKEADEWLQQFLEVRFHEFGDYEDAIVREQSILNHSLLSPLINVGLLSPQYVLDSAISYAEQNDIPLNSLEGFVRQIIGWREFIRGMYELRGSDSRNRNHFNYKKKIPLSFYTGETGVLPVDDVIKQVLETGYCHHIERLMILGNFMLLCEFHPDEVYRWFMELFIDAYDWVMVPNVYGMSQFADGGSFATKPYISSSNYIKKMSNYPKGPWQAIWDGLFWRFIDKHRTTIKPNPRMSMMLSTFERMPDERKTAHFEAAEKFLTSLK